MDQDSPRYAHCLEILSTAALFSSLEEAALKNMLGLFRYETRLKGETAISPQQASDHFYIIISGRAKVSTYNPENGREHILLLIGPGDSFDLISLLDGEWHEAAAIPLEDMEVLCTTVQQARAWIEQHPEFNRAFLPYLGKQMHELADQSNDLSLYDTEARLARLILRNLVDDESPQEVRLINDLSQETLAAMIGSVRVVVTRHLQKWKQEKIIAGKRGHWSILDLEALLNKANH